MDFGLTSFLSQTFSNFYFFIIVFLLSTVILANGFSDAPNAIATCVSTRAITPKKALIMAAICNFLGIFIMSNINASVATTIFKLIHFESLDQTATLTIVAALITIISWSTITGHIGIPTSESHALIASLTGASVALYNSIQNINATEFMKVLVGIITSIIAGFLISLIICKICETIFKNIDRRKTKKSFQISQILGGAMMSFMHGAQAGQKFIGVFLLGLLVMNGTMTTDIQIPIWLMIYCAILMGIGTSIGGYKVIRTVGSKLSNLELYQGAVVDISTSLCLLTASIFGVPISTSHTKSMSIVGVTACRNIKNINWNVIKNILLAGLITFPCCGLCAYIMTKILLFIGGIL